MDKKSWLLSFIFFFIFQAVIIEILYQRYEYDIHINERYHKPARHKVDYLINNRLVKIENESYKTLILGDSLARNAFGKLNLHKNILELTSNNAISLAGNYFILKRFLKKNPAPQNLYLFVIPDHLYQDLDTQHTNTFFVSVFNLNEEVNEIKEVRPNLFETNKNSFAKYTENRLKLFSIIQQLKPNEDNKFKIKHKGNAIKINEQSLVKSKFINDKMEKRIQKAKNRENDINEIPRIYIDKFIKLCKQFNIQFTIVIEPVPIEINNIFKQSSLHKYLLTKDLTLLNINDHYTFSNYFFRQDSFHIVGKVNHYYQNLIDEKILDIY